MLFPVFMMIRSFIVDDDCKKKVPLKYQILDHQKLILYSGMLQKWQRPDVLFRIF